jgi:hypothetical protein
MWWALGIAIWAVLLLVVVALCRAAADADLGMGKAHNKMLRRRMPGAKHQDHAA